MILSGDRDLLLALDERHLIEAILERRQVVRYFRDQVGDDRCFLDYYLIWAMVEGSRSEPRFSPEEGMEHCRSFYEHCRAEAPDAILRGVFCEIRRWDAYLPYLSHQELLNELSLVQQAIVHHRDVELAEGRVRNVDDDRELCRVILPELIPADFRLPPRDEFLISTTETSGCPAFWKSHAGCGTSCNLHRWGPCRS